MRHVLRTFFLAPLCRLTDRKAWRSEVLPKPVQLIILGLAGSSLYWDNWDSVGTIRRHNWNFAVENWDFVGTIRGHEKVDWIGPRIWALLFGLILRFFLSTPTSSFLRNLSCPTPTCLVGRIATARNLFVLRCVPLSVLNAVYIYGPAPSQNASPDDPIDMR